MVLSASSFPYSLSASASSNSSLPIPASVLPVSASSLLTATPHLLSSAPFPTSISPSEAASLNQTICTFDDSSLRLPIIIFYSLFFIFGLVGNLFALWVFIFLHSSRNSVRVLLINCAVADLVLLVCLPFRIFYHVNGNKWTLGSVACKVVGNLFYMNMYVSIMLLGLISLDRYLRLNAKGRARRCRMRLSGHSSQWSWVMCSVLWGLSLMALVPMIVTAEDKENNDQCFNYKQRRIAKGKAYFNLMLVVVFWLVFFILIVSYAKIASQLLRVSQDKPDLPNARKYNRTAKKSFFVLFLFSVCFGPYHAFRPVYILSQLSQTVSCDHLQLVDRLNEVMLLFSAFNSCLDPIMYLMLSGSVRKTALRVLGRRLGNRLPFLQDATSISSTEFRRSSAPGVSANPELNTLLVTPTTSICVVNSTFHSTKLPSSLSTVGGSLPIMCKHEQ